MRNQLHRCGSITTSSVGPRNDRKRGGVYEHAGERGRLRRLEVADAIEAAEELLDA